MPVLPTAAPFQIDPRVLEEFCKRRGIAGLWLFGSALREDFGAQSDLDILVSFLPEAHVGLLEHVAMQGELSGLLGRKVDLVSRRAVEDSPNNIRRKAILESAVPFYVAA